MRSSCLHHPGKDPMIIIRAWQIEFCGGDACAAALMSFFEYWHNIKLEQSSKALEANAVAEKHNVHGTQDTTLWQWHTEKQLVAGVLVYGATAIGKSLKVLERLGVLKIGRNPNPRFSFDNTKHFLFIPERALQFLAARSVKTDASCGESDARCGESDSRRGGSDATIPETTSENTTETPPSFPARPSAGMCVDDDPVAPNILAPKPKGTTGAYEEFIACFNKGGWRKANPQATAPKRRADFRARMKDPWWVANYMAGLARAFDSKFLTGKMPGQWAGKGMDLEFFLRPNTLAYILEGKYDDAPQAKWNPVD